jgi:2,4-dienoyl-CoA reductase-like NADH-dependent reductase (Old Yellow Enzyme family)
MVELFEPYRIGRLEIKNRFVRSATWDNTADSSGAVTDNSVAIYGALGRGGVGLIITGYAFVSPEGQARPGQYGAHTDKMLPGLRRLVQAAHQGGAKIALQIVHAGINSIYIHRVGLTALAVSRKKERSRPHREMTDEEIERVIADFAAAAVRAREAGFDAVQLHGAHGYLMSQFLSPLFNHRTDRWGGSTEKRRRFHLELVSKVRQAIGDGFPLMIKFGAQDDRKGGLPLSEGLETAKLMVAKGIDAIEVSAGVGIEKAAPILKKGDPEVLPFRERAIALKRVVRVPVILVGGIRSLQTAKNVVESGDADLISMCRPFIREPDLIARWQRGEPWPAKCISCHRCHPMRGEPVRCKEERHRGAGSIVAKVN